MTFRFPRFYNPFAVIRNLQAQLADTIWDNECLTDANCFLRSRRGFLDTQVAILTEAVDMADQALDAFMADREDQKSYIRVQDIAGNLLLAEVVKAQAVIDALNDEAADQASDTLEVVTYVKQVEQALSAGGITIEDSETGPVVVISEAEFLPATRSGTFKIIAAPRP